MMPYKDVEPGQSSITWSSTKHERNQDATKDRNLQALVQRWIGWENTHPRSMGKSILTEWVVNRGPFHRKHDGVKEQQHQHNDAETALLMEDDSILNEDDSHSTVEEEQMSTRKNVDPRLHIGKLMFGVFGIYAAYLSYGMYQEDLYRFRAPDGSSFNSVWFLQVLESAASIGLGAVGRQLCGGTKNLKLRPFFLSGAAQVFAKVFMSLSLVMGASFPVATLAKSAKIVPVMIGQLVLGGASYNLKDYMFAVLVVSGTVLLSLGKTNGKTDRSNDTIAGVCCILSSLLMDGCVGGLQKQMKRDLKENPPTTYDYVFFSHISMILIALFASFVSGDFWIGVRCLMKYPAVAKMVSAVCLLSVIGQTFIFFVISGFDPLVCATITTTRKIWSVLLSIAFKGYSLSMTGYVGLALAIFGLGMEVEQKSRPVNKKCTNELV